MPPVIYRLAGELNFKAVYRRGRRIKGPELTVNYLKVPYKKTRVAVVVSRKVSNLATKRNLYKRRLWGCLREHRQNIPTQYYIVINANPNIKDKKFQELSKEVKYLLEKIT